MILLLFLYGTKSREKKGPNSQQPAQCISPSEFYKNGYIQRYWTATIGFVVVRQFATGDVFVYLQ